MDKDAQQVILLKRFIYSIETNDKERRERVVKQLAQLREEEPDKVMQDITDSLINLGVVLDNRYDCND